MGVLGDRAANYIARLICPDSFGACVNISVNYTHKYKWAWSLSFRS